jgi:hypothetical protein
MRHQYPRTLLFSFLILLGVAPQIVAEEPAVMSPSEGDSNNASAKVVYLRSVVDSIQQEGCSKSLLDESNTFSRLPSWMALQELDLGSIQQSLLQKAFGYPLSSGDMAQVQPVNASNSFVPIVKGEWHLSCPPEKMAVNLQLQLKAKLPGVDKGHQCTINQTIGVKSISKVELKKRLHQNENSGAMVAAIRRACDPRNPSGIELTAGLMQGVYDWQPLSMGSRIVAKELAPQSQGSEAVISVVDFPELSFKAGSASSSTLPTTLHVQFEEKSEANEKKSVVNKIYLKREWEGENEEKTSCYTTPLVSELMSQQPFLHCTTSAERCRKALIGKLLSQKSVIASLSDSAQWRIRACPNSYVDHTKSLSLDDKYDSVVIEIDHTKLISKLESIGGQCGASLDLCLISDCLNSKYYLLHDKTDHTTGCREIINLKKATQSPGNYCSRPLEINAVIHKSENDCQLQLEPTIYNKLKQLFVNHPLLLDKGIIGVSVANPAGGEQRQ